MPRLLNLRLVIAAVALVNAILYCCALPLWEGFDEPFHYGYVQSLSVNHAFPVMNQTRVSTEIYRSLLSTPLTRLLSTAVPGSISFEEWAHLSVTQKQAHAGSAGLPDQAAQHTSSNLLNYEAQQAPLFYLLAAPLDAHWEIVPLRLRILDLRLLCAIVSTILLWIALSRLARELGVHPVFALVALLCLFELQMIWASVAHVGNDALSIPLTVIFLVELFIASRRPTSRAILLLALVLAIGLLVKAYFFAFVPVFALFLLRSFLSRHATLLLAATAFGIVLLGAGPWYGHNLWLYRSLSATQQSVAGIGLPDAVRAFAHIPWFESVTSFAQSSLWTGNWSFLSFSRFTLDAQLLLLLAGFVLYILRRRSVAEGEFWLLGSFLCFGFSLLYQAGVTFVHTHGQSIHPEPWYAQGILACLFVLIFRGFAQSGLLGRLLASVLCVLSAWVALATYWVKLLPYYGGAITKGNISSLWGWWSHDPTAQLSSVVLAPLPVVLVLLGLFSALAVIAAVVAVRAVWLSD